MRRKIVAILLTSKPNYDKFAFKYFILSLNKIQSYYEFIFSEIDNNYYVSRYYDTTKLFGLFEEKVRPKINFENKPDYLINIITSRIGENLFFECRGNVAFITTDTWEKYFSPPSLFEYLLHCIIASLLFMNKRVDLYQHRDTKGCCLDYTFLKMDDKVDIALGYICDKCKDEVINGIGEEYLTEIINIVNREWIGNINNFGSVAYNLKNFFKFDIDKDSGFNKTFWDKAKDHFYEIPKEITVLIIGAIIGILVTLLFK
jgi:hypothetical protein